MVKKVLWGFGIVFLVMELCEITVNTVLMPSLPLTLISVMRSNVRTEFFPIIAMFVSFLFSFIYSKGYERGGILEGLRYGLYMGLIMNIPMACGQYALYPIPYTIALEWFLYGMVKFLIMGAFVGVIFGKKQPAASQTG